MAKITLWGLNEACQFYYHTDLFKYMSFPSSKNIAFQNMRDNVVNAIMVDGGEFGVLYTNPVLMRDQITMWSAFKLPEWQRFLNALELEYNPIENYDRKESWTDAKSGEKHDTGSISATGSGTDSGSVAEKSSGINAERGTVTDTDTGTISKTVEENSAGSSILNRTVTDSGEPTSTEKVAAYNTESVLNNKKIENVTDNESVTAEISSSNINTNSIDTDTHNLTTQRTLNTDTLSDVQRSTEDSRTRTNMQTQTSAQNGTENVIADHTGRAHGNIGVTSSQELLKQEFEIARLASVFRYIADDFIRQFCIMVY